MSVREDISRTTRAIFFINFCACCLCPWLGPPPCLRQAASPVAGKGFSSSLKMHYRPKKGTGVHSTVKECYLLLPCLKLATCLGLARIDLSFDVRLASEDVRLALDSALETCAHLCQLQTSKSPELIQAGSLELTTAYLGQ